MSQPKIAIIGAGPAGCTLALILHKAGIPVIIFEGEASANSRHQGGTLDLHDGTGLNAIKRAGLYDEFTKLARYDGESFKVANKYLRLFLNMPGATEGSSRGRPEIDRAQLRELLVNALPPDTIQWNHRLRRVDDTDPTNITLHFDNGITSAGHDLLVGADGAWSKVRPLLTPVRPFYSGVNFVRYTITSASSRHPALHKLVNRGSLFAFSDGKGITAQQMSNGTLTVSTVRSVPETYAEQHPEHRTSVTESKRLSLADFADWDEQLLSLIREADETEAPWTANVYTLPAGLRWPHRAGVTLIGDAAHVMVPFAGEGVNVSMADSVNLADAIIASSQSSSKFNEVLSAKVRAYEEEMFVRAGRVNATSFEMMQCSFFDTGAPDESIVKYVSRAVEDGLPWGLVGVAQVAAKAYFSWLSWWYPGRGRIGKVE
ncbi:FAD/NAD(P)-binding domain-containing protein [Myriangium duriaei CBS 260.36]|uniref:FAD/NAD(P)-binding domain-containing protein n=1 Tax=Myriangium duriaei CBS 260.36 TaxID=1168546 RepID=A0A9P4IVM7_9PEZI|nr:FAD/NAD(P)-binding domain-containing protein [Myriangium duriaei CBS 260.36]